MGFEWELLRRMHELKMIAAEFSHLLKIALTYVGDAKHIASKRGAYETLLMIEVLRGSQNFQRLVKSTKETSFKYLVSLENYYAPYSSRDVSFLDMTRL